MPKDHEIFKRTQFHEGEEIAKMLIREEGKEKALKQMRANTPATPLEERYSNAD